MTRHAAPTHATKPNPQNLLSAETSPYLLQHKDNPVNWRGWNDAALQEARDADKPILLSVGYAACHWCHVMAHESFEDDEIAALMNARFVNIKIDREERPDLDQIYQQALALLGQQGGWPLTMFLTPQGQPYWGGTYFPKEPRYGRPGFGQVLTALSDAYRDDTGKVAQNVAGIAEAMQRLSTPQAGDAVPIEVVDRIAERLLQEVDLVRGGIGGAPKFPQGPVMTLLWRAYLRSGDGRFREAVLLSLTRMIQGGIYDHLGGGLARYATDADWLVPHFEKMLYDNAELLSLLGEVWIATGEPLFEARAAEIVEWLKREMLAESDSAGTSAFAASLDADSEGVEGKFYVWDEAEIDAVLGAEAPFFKHVYGVSAEGNWEDVNILNRGHQMGLLQPADERRLSAAREKLLARRAGRIRPGWDDKVLVDWNGLMIGGLAKAAMVFARPDWLDLAKSAFAFIERNMRDDHGRLKHAWRQGKLAHPATLDDHANLAAAALALHQASGDALYLDAAKKIVADLDAHYWDNQGGGYFFSADDTGDVIIRTKSANDNATPAGNGTMIEVLDRLYHLTGMADYETRADQLVRAFAGEVQRNFFPLATYLSGLDFRARATDVIIIGDRHKPDTAALLGALLAQPQAHLVLQVVADTSALAADHPAHGKAQVNQAATAYVCRHQTCSAPVTDPAKLAAALSA
ncbi:thioredoxin domain-containing protein [Dongia rigui]|uniref:Thioredoxin domain-containing protein n=1 Tax=Dongia rigui TaxID=940149 RepID=A0ABU5DXW9_9PROT|nr:thioredoxin domain-containing protein [Dongia rigui]MDY0872159.1 thioredoxin domain-containing protein [Dongia rigui]